MIVVSKKAVSIIQNLLLVAIVLLAWVYTIIAGRHASLKFIPEAASSQSS